MCCLQVMTGPECPREGSGQGLKEMLETVSPRRDWFSEKILLQCVAIPEMLGRSWVAKMLKKGSGLGRSACG